MAAITSQAPVVVKNLMDLMKAEGSTTTTTTNTKPLLKAQYDGYSSCPVVVNYREVLLTEFKYDNQLAESFNWLFNQGQPQWFFMIIKRWVS